MMDFRTEHPFRVLSIYVDIRRVHTGIAPTILGSEGMFLLLLFIAQFHT